MSSVSSSPPPTKQPKPKQSWGYFAWRVIRIPLLALLGVCLLLLWLENKLVYAPSAYPEGDWGPSRLALEDAEFKSADGTALHGWYVASRLPGPVILFCHGNAGNVTHRYEVIEIAQQLGASILVFDYRGYGKSKGTPNEPGVLADARAARKWLSEKTGVAENKIVLWGESLGGGVAVDLAAKDGAGGLVLEDTFTSLPDAAAHIYPWLPARWLMRGRLDSLSIIANYHGPLLLSHGNADELIPVELGEKLFAAANQPKTKYIERDATHNSPRSEEFIQLLSKFLKALPAR